ncbi:acyl carrier protein, mitochondrial-like isoform X1 [Lineus longissimus]|uniref:acyl carrier protein, mitochondrial-like isoform X1 n=1 Tax=Lineus longissimus TaxID=88925 RepID=UPI002B4D4758
MAVLLRQSLRAVQPTINAIALRGMLPKAATTAALHSQLPIERPQQRNFSVLSRSYEKAVFGCSVTSRYICTPASLTQEDVKERVLKICRDFDKIEANKLTLDSHFLKDLGLDSLDHVEVIMAMEDEFGFEIPDGDADRLLHVKDIVTYVCDKEDVFA